MSIKPKFPKIIGYFDLNLNCVYSAIVRGDETLVKHMVLSTDPDFLNQPMSRVEMSFAGYNIQPVVVKDQSYQSFEKRSSDAHPKAVHWAINWFKCDYLRWLTLSHHDKKQVAGILGNGMRLNGKKPNTQPTTSIIHRVGIIELIAAHVANAYCIDQDDGDTQYSHQELLELYLAKNALLDRHGAGIRGKVLKLLNGFDLEGAIQEIKRSGAITGVDSFIN